MSDPVQVSSKGQASFFSDPLISGFITESLSVFTLHQAELGKVSPQKLTEHSRKYKAVLLTWIDKFDLHISKLSRSESTEEGAALHFNLLNIRQLLQRMYTAWQLFELLFIDVRSNVARMIQLKEWMNFNTSEQRNIANEVVESNPMHEHKHFWQVAMFLILSGELDNAALIIESHPDSSQELILIHLLNLLREYPKLSPYSKRHEHFIQFEEWREKVEDKIRNCGQMFEKSPLAYIGEIKLMFYILKGDIEAFKEVTHVSPSWFDLMISFLLFTDPCLNQFTLSSLCDKFRQICADKEDPNERPFNDMIRMAFDYNLHECLLAACEAFNDNWWFASHFLDLICGSSLESELKHKSVRDFRAVLIRGYAISLYEHPTQLWFLAVEYLTNIEKSDLQIREILKAILSKRKISEREFEQLIHCSKRCDLPDFEQDVYRLRFKRVFQEIPFEGKMKNSLANGLFWAIKTKDQQFIDAIVDRFLEHYMHTAMAEMRKNDNQVGIGELLAPEFVLKLPSTWAGLSDKLGFLFKYYEFRQLVADKDYAKAINIPVEMLRLRAVPKYFQLQVMLDIVSLIEFEGIELSQDDIVTVTEAFERLSQQIKQVQVQSNEVWATEQDRKESTEEEKQMFVQQFKVLLQYEKVMRIAVVRNSSRNFLSVV